MSAISLNGRNLFFPSDALAIAQRNSDASVTVHKRTKARLWVSITIPGMVRDWYTDIPRMHACAAVAEAIAARPARSTTLPVADSVAVVIAAMVRA